MRRREDRKNRRGSRSRRNRGSRPNSSGTGKNFCRESGKREMRLRRRCRRQGNRISSLWIKRNKMRKLLLLRRVTEQ